MIDLPKLSQPKAAFVIYDPTRDAYSSGGQSPWWSKKTKIWKSWGSLKSHLAMFISCEFINKDYLTFAKRKYSLARLQPYDDGCMIYNIVTNSYVCRVKDLYNEMIIAREEQDKKDQKKQTASMIKQIKKMNDEAWIKQIKMNDEGI